MASVFVKKCVSALWSVNTKDWLRGLLMAVGSALLAVLGQGLSESQLPTTPEFIAAGKVGLCAGIMYILKQFGSGPKIDKP